MALGYNKQVSFDVLVTLHIDLGKVNIMERVAFRLKLKPGKRAEYRKMHDEIWPEMLEVLVEARISNYTIWCSGDDLFGYYEVSDRAHSNKVLASSPVVAKWNEIMTNIYYPDIDPETGTVREMELMFKYNLTE